MHFSTAGKSIAASEQKQRNVCSSVVHHVIADSWRHQHFCCVQDMNAGRPSLHIATGAAPARTRHRSECLPSANSGAKTERYAAVMSGVLCSVDDTSALGWHIETTI